MPPRPRAWWRLRREAFGPGAMFGEFVVVEAFVPNGELCDAGQDD